MPPYPERQDQQVPQHREDWAACPARRRDIRQPASDVGWRLPDVDRHPGLAEQRQFVPLHQKRAHDLTDDGTPELVVATRGEGMVKAQIYRLSGGTWEQIGTVGARGDVEEIRVFRQALTVKDKTSGTLYTWTCHNGRFDFKSSAGGPDPALGL